jgi:hypothetical protein
MTSLCVETRPVNALRFAMPNIPEAISGRRCMIG